MTAGPVRDGQAHGWVVSPVMGDLTVLLTLFLDPETDETCTANLVIQRSVDACGAWRREVGTEGRLRLMGCHIALLSCRNKAPPDNNKGKGMSSKEAQNRTGLPCRADISCGPLCPVGLGWDEVVGLMRPGWLEDGATSLGILTLRLEDTCLMHCSDLGKVWQLGHRIFLTCRKRWGEEPGSSFHPIL